MRTPLLSVSGGGAAPSLSRHLHGRPSNYHFRTVLFAVALLALFLLGSIATPAHARNTCAEISRCSECVLDQTQGIMPPFLLCGWCESTQTCKDVNSTVLAYYGVATTTMPTGDGDEEDDVSTLTPEEKAAFRAAFCEDLRERDLNGVCPDMSCSAARTTNNIYICRPPPLIALVLGCVLFVVTMVVYMWMRTIRQLPWKYEPFLSDLLEGRTRAYEEYSEPEEMGGPLERTRMRAVATSLRLSSPPPAATQARGKRTEAGRTTQPGSPIQDDAPPPPLQSTQPPSGAHASGDGTDSDASRAETASIVLHHSYVGNPSHNVLVAAPLPLTAATGYCPICKCRQPACLGPGEVCFWCNVARFTFVPFFIALISSVFVIVLDFAVSLKPWFSDWYFAEVLVVAYASYGALGLYMVRHHGRAPLFFFESEAERKACQPFWSTTHNRPCSSRFAPDVAASNNNPNNNSTLSPSNPRLTGPAGGSFFSHTRHKIHLLNDARRNMASTYYFHLALQLRGRPLLTCFPQLKRYEAQLEAMQASPATLTAVGDAVAVMRSAPGAGPSSGVQSAPNSPKIASQLNRSLLHNNNNNNSSGVSPSGALPGHAGVPIINVPVISPFAAAVSPSSPPSTLSPAEAAVEASAVEASAALTDATEAAYASISSPSASSAYNSPTTGTHRLPPLAHVAATTAATTNAEDAAARHGEAIAKGGGAAAAGGAAPPPPATAAAPPAPPAGGPIGSPAATNVPEALARQKRGETVQLLSSDFLSPQYCRALKSTLFRDEYITWCSKPNLRGVLMENEWLLLDLVAGFLFGVWMVMLSSVSDTSFPIVELSGSTAVAACGLIVMALFAMLLVIVVRQCGRLYVLTNERLITVYESVITPITTATDLSTVRFAALYGYRGLWSKQPCLTFSWEVPATERKMPVIKSHMFPGITNLQEFLFFFRLVAPQTPFHLDQISHSTKQDRQEWRLHMFLSVGAFVALPIITLYPEAMPEFLSVFLYVLGALVIFSTLLRGFRAQQMTYAPLNIAASWAPEGEGDEFNAVNAPRGVPVVAHKLPPVAAMAPAVQPVISQTRPSPTTQHPPPLAHDLGAGSTGRAVQVATSSSSSPVARTVGEFARPSPVTAAFPSPRERVVVNEPVVGGTAVAPAKEGREGGGRGAPAGFGSSAVSATAPPLPSVVLAPRVPKTAAAAPSPHALSTTAASAFTSNSSTLISVPVTAAVREMEESLLGVGITGGGLSANNSFNNAAAALHASASNSQPDTARNSPHRGRLSSIDLTGGGGGCVHTGTLSIGPGATTSTNSASAAVARAAAGNAYRNSTAIAAPGTTTTTSTACSSPTNASPSGLAWNLSVSSEPPREGGEDHHARVQRSISRSGSEGSMSTPSGGTPQTFAIAHHGSGSRSGAAAVPRTGSHHHHSQPLAHVVAASLRSTRQDGHTTWGDQASDQE